MEVPQFFEMGSIPDPEQHQDKAPSVVPMDPSQEQKDEAPQVIQAHSNKEQEKVPQFFEAITASVPEQQQEDEDPQVLLIGLETEVQEENDVDSLDLKGGLEPKMEVEREVIQEMGQGLESKVEHQEILHVLQGGLEVEEQEGSLEALQRHVLALEGPPRLLALEGPPRLLALEGSPSLLALEGPPRLSALECPSLLLNLGVRLFSDLDVRPFLPTRGDRLFLPDLDGRPLFIALDGRTGEESEKEVDGDLEIEEGRNLEIEEGRNLEIEAGGDLEIEAGGDLEIEAGGDLEIEAGGDLEMQHFPPEFQRPNEVEERLEVEEQEGILEALLRHVLALEGPPRLLALEGPPRLLALEGPPRLLALEGPPRLLALEGPPRLLALEGPPRLLVLDGSPSLLVLDGSPSLLVLDGSPSLLALEGRPRLSALECPSLFLTLDVRLLSDLDVRPFLPTRGDRLFLPELDGAPLFLAQDGQTGEELETEVDGGLEIEAGGGLEIEAGGGLKIEAGGDLKIEAGGGLEIEAGGGLEMQYFPPEFQRPNEEIIEIPEEPDEAATGTELPNNGAGNCPFCLKERSLGGQAVRFVDEEQPEETKVYVGRLLLKLLFLLLFFCLAYISLKALADTFRWRGNQSHFEPTPMTDMLFNATDPMTTTIFNATSLEYYKTTTSYDHNETATMDYSESISMSDLSTDMDI